MRLATSDPGLILCTHRYYDPLNARWLTRDPIGYDGDINLYGYVQGNPVMATDPSGLFEFWDIPFIAVDIYYIFKDIHDEDYASLAVDAGCLFFDLMPGTPGVSGMAARGGAGVMKLSKPLLLSLAVQAGRSIYHLIPLTTTTTGGGNMFFSSSTSGGSSTGTGGGSATTKARSRPTKVHIPDGNAKGGWIHVEGKHILGTIPDGDKFAPGTTRAQLETAANQIVRKGQRISEPHLPVQTFQERMRINGKTAQYRVNVLMRNGEVVSMYPFTESM
jgi:RHS repeat-associated protein